MKCPPNLWLFSGRVILLLLLGACGAGCGGPAAVAQRNADERRDDERRDDERRDDERRVLRVPGGAEVPELPSPAAVTSIDLRLAPPSDAEPEYTFQLTSRTEVGGVLALLRGIDWSQEGTPLEEIRLLAPDIELTVREASGVDRNHAFYWTENSFVDGVTNRLLKADLSSFRTFLVGALIRRVAAQRLQLEATIVPEDSTYFAALAPDGTQCAISYPRKGELVLWNIERREAVARSAELGRIRQLAFTAGGSHLICVRQVETADAGTASCEISLVNLPGLTIHSKVGNCPDPISVMRCSPDGRHVAAIAGGYVVVWNLKTGRRRELRAWKATPAPPPGKSEGGYPRCLAFSPLGRTLAVSADDRTLTLFNASDGKRLESLPTDTAFAALAFSPDLRLLAAGPAEVAAEFGDRAVGPWVKSVEFWNLQTKRQVVLGIQHESTNLLPAFTTGGVRLVTAGHKTLKLWDMTWWPTQDTKLLDTVDAHRGDIWLLQAAQNQDVLMSCGEKAIKLWRVGER